MWHFQTFRHNSSHYSNVVLTVYPTQYVTHLKNSMSVYYQYPSNKIYFLSVAFRNQILQFWDFSIGKLIKAQVILQKAFSSDQQRRMNMGSSLVSCAIHVPCSPTLISINLYYVLFIFPAAYSFLFRPSLLPLNPSILTSLCPLFLLPTATFLYFIFTVTFIH